MAKLRPLYICLGLSLLAHGGMLWLHPERPTPPRPQATRLEIGLVAPTREVQFSRARVAAATTTAAANKRPPVPEPPVLAEAMLPPPVPSPPTTVDAPVLPQPVPSPQRPQVPTLPDPVAQTRDLGQRRAAVASQPTRAAAPDYALNPPPAYPDVARRNGWSGEVLVRVAVAADGMVTSTGVETTSGFPVLDKAALRAVRRWHFLPAHRGAQNLPGEVLVPVRFRLSAIATRD